MKFKAILFALLLVGAAFGQKGEGEGEGGGGSPVDNFANNATGSYSGGAVVLHDQTGNPGGNGVPDQNFEAAFDAYDCMGADDFEVPADRLWTVETVFIVGTYTGTGVAVSVNVAIHQDAAGVPGTVVQSFTGLAPSSDVAGQITVNLPGGVPLGEGRYWVAMQINKDFGGGNGQHFWSNTSVQNFNLAAWINPGNGFGSGCTNWTNTQTCGVGGGATIDLQYSISGTDVPALMVPTLGQVGLIVFLVLLAGAALFFLRRQRLATGA